MPRMGFLRHAGLLIPAGEKYRFCCLEHTICYDAFARALKGWRGKGRGGLQIGRKSRYITRAFSGLIIFLLIHQTTSFTHLLRTTNTRSTASWSLSSPTSTTHNNSLRCLAHNSHNGSCRIMCKHSLLPLALKTLDTNSHNRSSLSATPSAPA